MSNTNNLLVDTPTILYKSENINFQIDKLSQEGISFILYKFLDEFKYSYRDTQIWKTYVHQKQETFLFQLKQKGPGKRFFRWFVMELMNEVCKKQNIMFVPWKKRMIVYYKPLNQNNSIALGMIEQRHEMLWRKFEDMIFEIAVIVYDYLISYYGTCSSAKLKINFIDPGLNREMWGYSLDKHDFIKKFESEWHYKNNIQKYPGIKILTVLAFIYSHYFFFTNKETNDFIDFEKKTNGEINVFDKRIWGCDVKRGWGG